MSGPLFFDREKLETNEVPKIQCYNRFTPWLDVPMQYINSRNPSNIFGLCHKNGYDIPLNNKRNLKTGTRREETILLGS